MYAPEGVGGRERKGKEACPPPSRTDATLVVPPKLYYVSPHSHIRYNSASPVHRNCTAVHPASTLPRCMHVDCMQALYAAPPTSLAPQSGEPPRRALALPRASQPLTL